MSKPINTRRRAIKQGSALLLTLASIPVAVLNQPAYAGTAAKSDFHYQDHPRDGKKCAQCSAYLAPAEGQRADGECRIVAGAINPEGWCMAFSAR